MRYVSGAGMSCSSMSPTTQPASASHLTTRHQARKYDVAPRTEPLSMKPNSQTQASIAASEPVITRI